MNLHALRDQPSPDLARALSEFDSRFTYPLGECRTFRIDHGHDYPRFFRAMGEARCFVAERQGRVLGAVAVAIRSIQLADGGRRQAAYIGDLKIDPALRGSLAFLRLARAADAWARPQVSAAYGVVMDGTSASPESYTGRIGIPPFLQIGKIIVLRFATAMAAGSCPIVSATQGAEVYRSLSRGRLVAIGGNPAERSEMAPVWFVQPQGLSCGRLEDTRRAKRLFDSGGQEMRSAHLACFAWATPSAALEVLGAARAHAARLGFPHLFVAVSQTDMKSLEPVINGIDKVIAPATIYGVGLPGESEWSINTSEI